MVVVVSAAEVLLDVGDGDVVLLLSVAFWVVFCVLLVFTGGVSVGAGVEDVSAGVLGADVVSISAEVVGGAGAPGAANPVHPGSHTHCHA